jgi:S1-C subfamily serine protease
MRHIHLLAISAATLAATATAAAAQDRGSDAVRAPTARTFIFDGQDSQSPRAALGVGTSSTGTARDTLGLMITSVTRGGPAEKAGLEEGNRIAAINGVSLRANAADLEDYETGNTLSRRLVRELSKAKPGDEVELRVYRDGRSQTMKVRTVSSDSLFRRGATFRTASRADFDDRPALGLGIGSSGSRRDTLGVLVISVQDSTPAARAGIEEGNRIAAINGVNLRVAHEDAGDPSVGGAKAQRLQREVSQLKPGDNVTLRVYANGQFRDVTMKVARAGDLPRGRFRFGGGEWYFPGMPPMPAMAPMPAMPAMPAMPSMPAMPPIPPLPRMGFRELMPIARDVEPAVRERMNEVRFELDRMRPELQRMRPELDRLQRELPRIMRARGVEMSI